MSDKLKRHASAAEDSAYEQDVAEQPVPALLSGNSTRPPKRPISWLKNLTVLGRASLLMAVEIAINVLLWAITLITFLPHPEKRNVASLALVAWTLGLRHALDADHICAIDNSIRRLISLGQVPVTVGTFFSLGHSTVVICATIAIIISASVANKLDKFQNIGGYIGVSISSSFLLLVAIINSVILYRTIQARKRFLRDSQSFTEEQMATMQEEIASNTCLSRLAKPLFKMIDAPWKLYPLGCVFGLGFDTASSVLLLSLSAIASASLSDHPAELILLPLLFTAGMTAVDSLDGIIMVLAYCQGADALKAEGKGWKKLQFYREHKGEDAEDAQAQQMRTKMATFSSLSIVLTSLSIAVAFVVAFVQLMSVAAEQLEGAEKPGLEGRWWRFWLAINDGGWLGIVVVCVMAVVILTATLVWYIQKRRQNNSSRLATD